MANSSKVKIVSPPTWTTLEMASRFGFIGTIEDDQEVENDDLDSEEDEVRFKDI